VWKKRGATTYLKPWGTLEGGGTIYRVFGGGKEEQGGRGRISWRVAEFGRGN